MIRRTASLLGVLLPGVLLLSGACGVDCRAADRPTDRAAADDSGGALDFADQKSGVPLEVYADQGLELSQDAKTVIGRGNAKAIRGRVTVTADVLIAHYREHSGTAGQAPPPAKAPGNGGAAPQPGGNSEIWRVEATGHVTIASPSQTATGDHADYNIDDAVVVLTGTNLRLVTPTDTVTARDSLEFWERTHQAVARGNAVALRGEKRIQADVLVADFSKNSQQQMEIRRARGYDKVVLTTPHEVVTGDRADYLLETGIVNITGSVKMTRDDNQLDGGYAVVNLNTGVSRLYPVAPGGRGTEKQVKGLFVPQQKPGAGDGPAGNGR